MCPHEHVGIRLEEYTVYPEFARAVLLHSEAKAGQRKIIAVNPVQKLDASI